MINLGFWKGKTRNKQKKMLSLFTVHKIFHKNMQKTKNKRNKTLLIFPSSSIVITTNVTNVTISCWLLARSG